MHELGIAQEIVNIALRSGQNASAKSITSVHVKVGEFTAVDPHSLEFCFAMLTQRTIADGAALAVEVVPLRAKCSACKGQFVPQGLRFKCPICGSQEVQITSGRELCVDSIEVT